MERHLTLRNVCLRSSRNSSLEYFGESPSDLVTVVIVNAGDVLFLWRTMNEEKARLPNQALTASNPCPS
jgi:hypothetical protein